MSTRPTDRPTALRVQHVATVFGLIVIAGLASTGCDRSADPVARTGTETSRPGYRPADHFPPAVRETIRWPVPAPVDGFSCADIYRGDDRVGRVSPTEIPGAVWTAAEGDSHLAGTGIPYRTPPRLDGIKDLLTLLREAGIPRADCVKVLGLGSGVKLGSDLLHHPDCRFYFIYNRKKILKFLMHKNLRDGPGGADHWMVFPLVKGAQWVEVEAREPAESRK